MRESARAGSPLPVKAFRRGVGVSAFRAGIVLVAASTGTGCATMRSLSSYTEGSPVVFGGTRIDVAAMKNRSLAKRRYRVGPPRYPAVDLPFSFLVDAALFPFLLPAVVTTAVIE